MYLIDFCPFVPLGTQGVCKVPPSDSVLRQPFKLRSTSYNMLPSPLQSPFPSLLRSFISPHSLWIPVHSLFFYLSIILSQCMTNPLPLFLCVYTAPVFSPIASHNSTLHTTSGHLITSILRKQRLTKTCNLFGIWVVTFHASHPYSKTNFTLPLKVRPTHHNAHIFHTVDLHLFIKSQFHGTHFIQRDQRPVPVDR
jgi:hypothetical protein